MESDLSPHGSSCQPSSSSSRWTVAKSCWWSGGAGIEMTSSPGDASLQGCPRIGDLKAQQQEQLLMTLGGQLQKRSTVFTQRPTIVHTLRLSNWCMTHLPFVFICLHNRTVSIFFLLQSLCQMHYTTCVYWGQRLAEHFLYGCAMSCDNKKIWFQLIKVSIGNKENIERRVSSRYMW